MWLPETINGKPGLILQVLVWGVQADFCRALPPSPLIREHLVFWYYLMFFAFSCLEKQSARESALFKRKRKAVNLLKLNREITPAPRGYEPISRAALEALFSLKVPWLNY